MAVSNLAGVSALRAVTEVALAVTSTFAPRHAPSLKKSTVTARY